ncbi:MAG TPA: response regulator [Alphaproteobacteria bacterium]
MATILVIEDHDDVRAVLCEAVKSAGHEADCVRSVTEAKHVMAMRRHDLVISDMVLPDGDGRDLVRFALARGQRAMLMTGYTEIAGEPPVAMGCIGVLHLRKPFSLDRLLDTIDAQLSG